MIQAEQGGEDELVDLGSAGLELVGGGGGRGLAGAGLFPDVGPGLVPAAGRVGGGVAGQDRPVQLEVGQLP